LFITIVIVKAQLYCIVSMSSYQRLVNFFV